MKVYRQELDMESMKYRINKADYKILAGCKTLDDRHFRRRYLDDDI